MPALRPLTVSAPFGNYIQPAGCTATLGTYTTMDRPGRPWRVVKTVRYYPRIKAWVNQIGLRNPGIGWLTAKVNARRIDASDKLVSVHGFNDDQWWQLLDAVAGLKPLGVELNMSCPNVGEIGWPAGLFERAVATGVPVVVKLPPVNYATMAERAVGAGVRWLHCCNTLPVPGGGMSGRPLKPVALQCIRDLRGREWMSGVHVLGGGGIREPGDLDDYADAGADRFAVGSYVMNPALLITHRRVTPLRARAEQLVKAPSSAA